MAISKIEYPLFFGVTTPASYINAASWQEALSLFCEKLNECIEQCNEMSDYKELVEKALQEMYDNGELTEILELVSESFFNQFKIQTLNIINQITTSYVNSTKTLHLTRGGDFEWQR